MWWGYCTQYNRGVRNVRQTDTNINCNFLGRYYSCIDEVYHNLSLNILNHQTYPGMSLDHIYDLFCDGMEDVMSSCIWTHCYGPKDMIEKRNENLRILQSVIFKSVNQFNHFWSLKSELNLNFLLQIFIETAKVSNEKFQCQHLTDIGYQSSSTWFMIQNQWIVSTIILVILLWEKNLST